MSFFSNSKGAVCRPTIAISAIRKVRLEPAILIVSPLCQRKILVSGCRAGRACGEHPGGVRADGGGGRRRPRARLRRAQQISEPGARTERGNPHYLVGGL